MNWFFNTYIDIYVKTWVKNTLKIMTEIRIPNIKR